MEYMESKMQDQIEGGLITRDELEHEISTMKRLAKEAYDAWANDRDVRLGKLLIAMMDYDYRLTYRPDLIKENK